MCNVALLVSVSMCVCPHEPVFVRVHARTHIRVSASAYVLDVCVCVSVPQYQILLSQLSASLSLVVICLSTSQPSTPPSVSLFLPFFQVFFNLDLSVLHPSVPHCIFSSSLLACFFLPLHLPASLPQCPLHPSL